VNRPSGGILIPIGCVEVGRHGGQEAHISPIRKENLGGELERGSQEEKELARGGSVWRLASVRVVGCFLLPRGSVQVLARGGWNLEAARSPGDPGTYTSC